MRAVDGLVVLLSALKFGSAENQAGQHALVHVLDWVVEFRLQDHRIV
jgi:hypothetical protein